MTRTDQKILFTALAFLAVAAKGERGGEKTEADKVKALAAYIESFCLEHIGGAMLLPPDAGVEQTDQLIERHIQALKTQQETQLPEDQDTLIQLYDRLQQRKSRRMQREFYASATEDKLADLVLSLLDEEIEDDEALT